MTDIGKVLQEARMQKGLTLDDLQQITKIQKRYLIAIESNDFDSLPGEFYVRAFVRQYAETVDLNADELLASMVPAEPATPSDGDVVPEQTKRTQAQESEQNATKLERLYGYLPTIVIVVIVVGILGTIWAMTFANHNKNANSQIDDSSSSVAVSSDVSGSSSSEKSKAVVKQKKTNTSSKQTITYTKMSGSTYYYTLKHGKTKNQIKISASGRAWNAVSADGVQTWQGTLTSGNSHTVTLPANTKTIKLQIGNASYTTIKINGKTFNFKAQSSSSTVRTISITVK